MDCSTNFRIYSKSNKCGDCTIISEFMKATKTAKAENERKPYHFK